MSLIIDADIEYLAGTGEVIGASGLTAATLAIWVKRVAGDSFYQGYAYVGLETAEAYGSMWIAHNGYGDDCWTNASGAQRRTLGGTEANSTSWQLLVQVFKQNSPTKVYTYIPGGSLVTITGETPTELFNADIDWVRIGGNSQADGWWPRARLAHCAFWNTDLSAAQVADLASGGTAGAGKNPQSIQAANLKFYASLASSSAVTVGGITLSATGAPAYDAADNPNVEASGHADTTAPSLSGALTVSNKTGTGYTVSWPAGSDDTAVTGYEYRINGGAWTATGNVLTANISGRTPGATDTFEVRAYDAAANKSSALSQSVTLYIGTITLTDVTQWETNVARPSNTGITVDISNISTGALVVRKTGQVTTAGSDMTIKDALIADATTYQVVLRFADGSVGVGDVTASLT